MKIVYGSKYFALEALNEVDELTVGIVNSAMEKLDFPFTFNLIKVDKGGSRLVFHTILILILNHTHI